MGLWAMWRAVPGERKPLSWSYCQDRERRRRGRGARGGEQQQQKHPFWASRKSSRFSSLVRGGCPRGARDRRRAREKERGEKNKTVWENANKVEGKWERAIAISIRRYRFISILSPHSIGILPAIVDVMDPSESLRIHYILSSGKKTYPGNTILWASIRFFFLFFHTLFSVNDEPIFFFFTRCEFSIM